MRLSGTGSPIRPLPHGTADPSVGNTGAGSPRKNEDLAGTLPGRAAVMGQKAQHRPEGAEGALEKRSPPGKAVTLASDTHKAASTTSIANRSSSQSAEFLSPGAISRKAQKTMERVVLNHLDDDNMGNIQPPSMPVILNHVDRMVAEMGGKKLSAEQVTAMKEGVKHALQDSHPDIARRCIVEIDRVTGTEMGPAEPADPDRLHPAALLQNAKSAAAIVRHTQGQMTVRAARELFDQLDDIHAATLKPVSHRAPESFKQAAKKAHAEVAACILDTAQSLKDTYAATRSPEDLRMLRAAVSEAISDEALTGRLLAIFDTPPSKEDGPGG